MENKILLSICIPTYNRARYLEVCLTALISKLAVDLPIEIIISDNCSTDDTQDVIEKFRNSYIRSFSQVENIGAAKNILSVVDSALGEYCWIIGDDDYIIEGILPKIIDTLNSNLDIDFFFLKVVGTSYEIINSGKFEVKRIGNFQELLTPAYSSCFLGEVMGAVFRRRIWSEYDFNDNQMNKGFLVSLEATYPHCVVYANQFMNTKCAYIPTPVIIADDSAREWWDKLGFIIIVHFYNLLKLYRRNGLKGSTYRICKEYYFKVSLPYVLKFLFSKDSDLRSRIRFSRYFLILFCSPKILLGLSFKYLNKKVKSIFRHEFVGKGSGKD